jgi:Mn2+/Fe2+ NRAMP family transporter
MSAGRTEPAQAATIAAGHAGAPAARGRRALLASLGPGLVFALTVVGMGDFVANSSLGATHGYAFLWLLVISVVFRFVWLDTSARYVLVTGETLIDGFARLGRPIVFALFLVAPLLCHLTNMARVVLVGEAAQLLLPLPVGRGAAWYSLVFTAIALAVTLRGGYSWLETFCKWLIAALGSGLLAAAILSGPDPIMMARGLIPSIPEGSDTRATWLMITALIGTEAGSLTNLTYASFLREKGWRDASALPLQRRDLLLSVSAILVVGLLTQIAATNTLYGSGVRLEDARDLSRVIADRLGAVGVGLFAIGLWGKIFSSSVGVTTGYSLIISDIGRRYVPGLRREAPHNDRPADIRGRDSIFRWTASLLLISPLYVLLTDWTPVTIVLVGQSAMVVMIPILSVGLLWLTRRRDRMGAYASGTVRTGLLLVMTLVSFWVLWRNAAAWIDL